jgi:hypothetical protein
MVKIETKNDIEIFRIKYGQNKEWEQWVLLTSDEHFDSKDCDRKLLKRHHDQAKERNAIILKLGDVFDCMGGNYDPRSGKGDLRPEYNVKNYFDVIVKDAANFYEPYKDNIQLIATGNHEASVLKRQETDLIGNLCERLNTKSGKYSGFIRFMFEAESGSNRTSKLLYYSHGSGGNSPVTRGVIKTNRRQNFISSDIFVSGHTHNEFTINLPMVAVNEQGNIVKKEQTHISLGTYKDDSFSGGWSDMNEFPPPNMGGAWLRFHYHDGIKFDVIRAV